MSQYDWEALMKKWNKTVLESGKLRSQLGEIKNREWLGNKGVNNQNLDELEKRLGVSLPESYKSFLIYSNGWEGFASMKISKLLPADDVIWFKDEHGEWIEAWGDDDDEAEVSNEEYYIYDETQMNWIKPSHFRECLLISSVGDQAVIVLNPMVKIEGEWEAWEFANWFPGAARFLTFWDLMNHTYLELKKFA